MGRLPQFGYSIEKCSDSEVFFVVSLVDTGDPKTRLSGGPQLTHWKVVIVPEGTEGLFHSCSCTQETGFCSQYSVFMADEDWKKEVK